MKVSQLGQLTMVLFPVAFQVGKKKREREKLGNSLSPNQKTA